MRFSLVTATLGRTVELQRLLESLNRQTHRDFELIVVDQNADSRVSSILGSLGDGLEIRRVTSARGLSVGRNRGLRECRGDIVSFPDDDCWYDPDLLKDVNGLLTANPGWDGVLVDAVNESGNRILPWRDQPGLVTKPVCWRHALAYAYFVRPHVFQNIGGFDETLGVGSEGPWQCGEDNDLVLRAIEAGFQFQYHPSIRVRHPVMFKSYAEPGRTKRYSYALGEGRLLRKHPMPWWWATLFYVIPVTRAIAALLRMRQPEARFHWATLAGRVRGFRWSKHEAAGHRAPPSAELQGDRDR